MTVLNGADHGINHGRLSRKQMLKASGGKVQERLAGKEGRDRCQDESISMQNRRSNTDYFGARRGRCVFVRWEWTGQGRWLLLTSTQLSSFISGPSSFVLEPLTATLLLGGARSSALLMAGLFLSSILDIVGGRGEAEGVVAAGIRSRVTPANVSKRLRCASGKIL
jgi:hypothetical protein